MSKHIKKRDKTRNNEVVAATAEDKKKSNKRKSKKNTKKSQKSKTNIHKKNEARKSQRTKMNDVRKHKNQAKEIDKSEKIFTPKMSQEHWKKKDRNKNGTQRARQTLIVSNESERDRETLKECAVPDSTP